MFRTSIQTPGESYWPLLTMEPGALRRYVDRNFPDGRVLSVSHHFHSADPKRGQHFLDQSWERPDERVFPWDRQGKPLYRPKHSRVRLVVQKADGQGVVVWASVMKR